MAGPQDPAKSAKTARRGDLGGGIKRPSGGTNTLLLVLAAAVAAFLLRQATGSGDQAEPTPTPMPSSISVPAFGPAIVTATELASRAKTAGYPTGFPLYWAGEVTGTEIELTVLDDGTWAVRYLAPGAPAGSTSDSLTVATFYEPDGANRVTTIAEQEGAKSKAYDGGAVAASESASAHEISFAFQDYPLLVVVTSADPDSAWGLLDSGVIQPISQ